MNSRFLVFICIVLAVLSAAASYVVWHWTSVSPWAGSHAGALWLASALFLFLQILGPYLYRVYPDHAHRLFFFHWTAYMTLGAFGCVVFYTLAADLALLAGRFFLGASRIAVWEAWSFTAVAGLVGASVVIGAFQAARGPKVYEVGIPIENLPRGLEGFRIVQITDLHVGPTIGRKYAEGVVARAKALKPDCIVLTGDLVDGTVPQLRAGVAPLAGLQAPYGVYYVTGNHEYYWGAADWIAAFRALGFTALVNENAVIVKDGARLALAGVTDDQAGDILPEQAADLGQALAGIPEDAVRILLSHRPSHYREAEAAGVHLELSGHTHGGQFFPWSLIVGLAFRYGKGLHRFGKLWVYVSRGTGYWGPPMRFGVPAEMTLLRLKKA